MSAVGLIRPPRSDYQAELASSRCWPTSWECPRHTGQGICDCSCLSRHTQAWFDAHPAPDPWFPDERSAPGNAIACDCTFGLAQDSQGRKDQPMCTGLLDYFPDALAEVSELSRMANEKHNPGEPVHWSRGKSNDHADCIVRHLLERGGFIEGEYPKAVRHSVALAWRALALAQVEIEAARADGKISRGSR